MYSLHFYGEMIANRPRVERYVEALRQAVKPDSVVLDLGCGQGLFALLACRFGARRVYAIEPDNVINIAREAAAANGFRDRIEFFQSVSTEVTLPEPATIIISDLRGVLPWFQKHIPSIVDARQRLLAPGGVLIPRRDIPRKRPLSAASPAVASRCLTACSNAAPTAAFRCSSFADIDRSASFSIKAIAPSVRT